MNKKYDYLVYIGRFQPLHFGHQSVIFEALKKANKVIICIGSANVPRNCKNPFTYEERKSFIDNLLSNNLQSDELKKLVTILPINDYPYSSSIWNLKIKNKITNTILHNENPNDSVTLHGIKDFKIGIIGHEKDESSYYLKELSDFMEIDYVPVEHYYHIHATDVRTALFKDKLFSNSIPMNVVKFLNDFKNTATFKKLQNDYNHIQSYFKSWNNSPFSPQFHTTDAIITFNDKLLLIKRGMEYGEDRYALPGGYVESNLFLFQNVCKEIKEETNISSDMLKHIRTDTFDYPGRSQKGRIITTAYRFEIENTYFDFNMAKAGDDANEVVWIDKNRYVELNLHDMFEDHHYIIEQVLGWKLNHVKSYE